MKPLILLAFAAMLAGNPILAQSPDYDDLLNLFVDEKYDKLLRKAEGYTLDDKTKKDPVPYLFMSMGYYEMSKLDEYKTDYPNAFKDALKYLSKYASKDKNREFGADYEDFFNEIRKATISEAEIMTDQEKYTKAKSMYGYLIDLDPNDAGAYIMEGMTFQAMKSKKEAETSFKAAKELLSSKKCTIKNKDQMVFLKSALIRYATYLNDSGSKTQAIEWLDLGKEFFPDDKEYQVNYESIGG